MNKTIVAELRLFETLCRHSGGKGEIALLVKNAADAIEELQGALLLMVLQYCTTDDGVLYHSCMSAGENAFAVLGLENGQQADPLWDSVFNQKPLKEQAEEGE